MLGNIFDNIIVLEKKVLEREKQYDESPTEVHRAKMKKSYALLAQALAIQESY